jgi:hypothetical protein
LRTRKCTVFNFRPRLFGPFDEDEPQMHALHGQTRFQELFRGFDFGDETLVHKLSVRNGLPCQFWSHMRGRSGHVADRGRQIARTLTVPGSRMRRRTMEHN